MNEKGIPIVYESDKFKLSEMEILNLIKVCTIERRSKLIGKKLIAIYRDSNPETYAEEKLNLIGVKNEKPKIFRNHKTK